MKKQSIIAVIFLIFLFSVHGNEKKEPIHVFLMIDKSLSMEEDYSFSFLQDWLNKEFLPNNVKKGDSLTVFFFYGETKRVFNKTINTEADLIEIQSIISKEKPNGPFTDIGLAMDSLKEAVQNAKGLPIALIFSDLIQEAAYPSKYAGTYYDFAERYLNEDRVFPLKENYYQVTLQLERPETIEKRAKTIYTRIKDSTEEPLYRQ